MFSGRNKLYLLLFIACAAGYSWIFYDSATISAHSKPVEGCLLKHIAGIPCPSCGSTRSVLALMQGNLIQSLYINPFGILIALLMLIVPVWIIADLVTKRKTLFDYYRQAERLMKKPRIAFPLLFLVLVNWIWNITKGL